tara:strand:- start:720 stop:974 length:255 start_codon:yes stop_codon:yes gene_type:complete
MKKTMCTWWAFFWRYVIIFFILLFLLGFFSGVQGGIYLETLTSPHAIVHAIRTSDDITLIIINSMCHIVASFISIYLVVRKKKL